MGDRYCTECSMPHDRCPMCGAAVVSSVYLHRTMNAHGTGPHWCLDGSPEYTQRIRDLIAAEDNEREMLSECQRCHADVIRRANSPALFDPAGYYGLLGRDAVHQCPVVPVTVLRPATRATEPRPIGMVIPEFSDG